MPVLGITGGIATGKSTFTRALLRHLPAELFDADACAKELLDTDPAVREKVRQSFGAEVFDAQGQADRAKLRRLVFADETRRKTLEAILHPAIRETWIARAKASAAASGWFCVDIPLLFETAAEPHFDRVIVVACTPATQRARLREARGLTDEVAAGILAAQLDLHLKINRADHLIWNDSTVASLEEQAALLAGWLRQRYG